MGKHRLIQEINKMNDLEFSTPGGNHMTEVLITTLISVCASFITALVTLKGNNKRELKKQKVDIAQNNYAVKRDKLNEIYVDLMNVVNKFPNISPNDVLQHIDYAPNYSLESFDAIITSLGYQIEDYKERLSRGTYNEDELYKTECEIREREFAIEKIAHIKKEYFEARELYDDYKRTKKAIFDLYAGIEVKNCVVCFDVIIHNVFISGKKSGDPLDVSNNLIERARRDLINSMKSDMGLDQKL